MPEATPDTAAGERWFVSHGLPWFVDDIRADVHRGLRRGRLALVALVGVVVGAATAAGIGLAGGGWLTGVLVGLNLAVLWAVGYGLVTLRAWVIATWAARRTFSSLGLLFPLVTRALPLLLLFVTFLFINAEVWQVTAHLEGQVMWLTVALFLAITVGFLLTRLPEELAVFDDQLDPDLVARRCEGTPMAGFRPEGAAPAGVDLTISGLQKVNLVLMLLVTQLIQVLLLSASVFAFFIVFGMLVMDPEVIRVWIAPAELRAFPEFARLSRELVQVSVFLAAFSGLYFTVYAVTDDVYRKQFFTAVLRELERAVSVRAAYRSLRAQSPTSGTE